jgi:5-methylcytosine-specific restriction enzyme A
MPALTAPVGYCSTPGCPNRAKGQCPDHAKARRQDVDQRRGSRHERGYDNRWLRLSARFKAAHPFCGMRADHRLHADHSLCVQQGIRYAGGSENPLMTDHILPKMQGGTDDEANLQVLCARCHSTKTTTVDNGFGRLNG